MVVTSLSGYRWADPRQMPSASLLSRQSPVGDPDSGPGGWGRRHRLNMVRLTVVLDRGTLCEAVEERVSRVWQTADRFPGEPLSGLTIGARRRGANALNLLDRPIGLVPADSDFEVR